MNILLVLLVGLAMALGLAGVVVPVLPGLPVVWAAALVYGIVEGFGTVGIVVMVVLSLLLVAGESAGYVLAHRRGRSEGATRTTLVVGTIGAVLGFFFVPVVGVIVGGAAGVLVSERTRLGSWEAAWRSTKSVLRGFGEGVLVQLGVGIVMVGTWLGWVLAG